METKANTAIIGAFTLAVLAFAFGFIYWLAGNDRGITKTDLTVVFSGPVAGLDVGSTVYFNGIPIGDVRLLQFHDDDPSNVLARLSVNADTPIRVDSKASLGFQGITGIAYVDISGGSAESELLLKKDERVMWAEKSAFEDLVAGARQILSRADTVLETVEDVVTTNADSVENTLKNVETFTSALADNSEDVSSFLEAVSGAADAIADISGQLKGVVARAETLLADFDSSKLQETLDNIAKASARLDGIVEKSETIIASVDPELVKQTTEQIANAVGRVDGLVARGEDILAAVDPEKVRQTVDSVNRVTGEIEGFVKQGEEILAAVDPEKLRETVEGVASLSNTLTARKEDIDTIVTSLSTNLQNATDFTARLPDIGKKTEEILAAVDTEKVNQSIDDVHQFTTALGDSSEDVDAIVANIKTVSEQASSLLAKIDNMAGGEEGEGLVAEARATLTSIRVAADRFSAQAESIGGGVDRFANQGLRDLQAFVQEGRRAVSRLDRLISNLDRNPSQVLFGSDNVPQYRGGQRR
jgi:phospholipid/cholesterol/gamma-HCH transport system substrate-binding protein